MRKLYLQYLFFTIVFTVLFQFCTTSKQGGVSKLEILRMETKAKELFDSHKYHLALDIYKKLDSIKPNDPYYFFPLGVCYLDADNHEKALQYFTRCLKNPRAFGIQLYYYTGKAYQFDHQFDSAKQHYLRYLTIYNEPDDFDDRYYEINRLVEQCDYAKEMIANPTNAKIYNLSAIANSQYPEYAPVITADESQIIFTSNRPGTTGGNIDEFDGLFYEDIYTSYKKPDGSWTVPVKLSDKVNSDQHDASISLTADGQELIVYRYSKNTTFSKPSGDLYRTALYGEEWTSLEKLPEPINSSYWEPSAFITDDLRTMYFASNRPEGKGGTDIYEIKKLPNGEWAKPRNLEELNTPFNEDSPYLLPDGKTLYFSSMGHKCIGGYDIFMSKYNDSTRKWSEPKNIGYPLNTAHDDIHFVWSADGQRAYFSAIRPESIGNKDIFYATVDNEETQIYLMKGKILSSDKKPVDATITVKNLKTGEIYGKFRSNSSTGKYILALTEGNNYEFVVESPGYRMYSEKINIYDLHEYKEVTEDIQLEQE